MHADPLEQLTDAVIAADHLGEVADHLIGHFVDQARRSGASWTEIGRSMGVTKQAVQKRFVPKAGPATWTPSQGSPLHPRARNVVVQRTTPRSRPAHANVGPGPLILGLLDEPEAIAAKAIAEKGVTAESPRGGRHGDAPCTGPRSAGAGAVRRPTRLLPTAR